MSQLEVHSNGSHSVMTESGRKNIHHEVYYYIKTLQAEVKRQQTYIKTLEELLLKSS